MKNYIILVNIFKHGKSSGQWSFSEYLQIQAQDKEDAKIIARGFRDSTYWAMDLTAYADLRTLKQIHTIDENIPVFQ